MVSLHKNNCQKKKTKKEKMSQALIDYNEEKEINTEMPDHFVLRDYQSECVEGIRSFYKNGDKAALIVVATGGGKTVIFSEIARQVLVKGGNVVVIAHRGELIRQAAKSLQEITGIMPAIEKATQYGHAESRLLVASIQSMQNKRLLKYDQDQFSLVIIDEAHHAPASTYKNVLNYFDNSFILGVTATPNRSDRVNLTEVFDGVAYEIHMLDLIKRGYLAPLNIKSVPIDLDFSKLTKNSADYSASEFGELLDPHIQKVVDLLKEHAPDRFTVAFFPTIASSKKFMMLCNKAGLSCSHIDGTTPDVERHKALSDLKTEKINVLSNVMVLTEGTDIPRADCILPMRATKSQGLYAQMVGRGTRLHDRKKDCLLLDPLFLHEDHNLMKPANLVAKSDDHLNEMKELARLAAEGDTTDYDEFENDEQYDLGDLADEAQSVLLEKMKEKMQEVQNKNPVMKSIEEVSALFGDDSMIDCDKTTKIFGREVTEKQREMLSRAGVGIKTIEAMSRGDASLFIDSLMKRRKAGLCTLKQARMLKRFGEENVNLISFEKASELIDKHYNK